MPDDDLLAELKRMRTEQEERDRDILARLEKSRPKTEAEARAEARALISSGLEQSTAEREAAKRAPQGGDDDD